MSPPQAAHEQIVELLSRAEKDTIVANAKAVINLLKQHGLMYEIRVHSKHVGVHPCNRDGLGVSSVGVQDLLNSIFSLGWDWSEAKRLAVEADEGNRDAHLKFNEQLVTSSAGVLAPIKDHLMFLSLQGSHTNQVLRSIYYGCLRPNEAMTEHGKLSCAKLEGKDEAFAEAVRQGCTWQVLSAKAVQLYPSLPSILQAAGNACGQVAQGEHEVQMLQRVFSSWKSEQANLKPGFQVEFSNIKARVATSASVHLGAVPAMYTFLLKFAGGDSGDFLRETVAYVKYHGKPNVEVGSQVYQTLGADFKGDVMERLARVRHALLKLAYSGSDVVTKQDVQRLVNPSDKVFAQKVKEAEAIMNEYRGTLNAAGAQHPELFKLTHNLDCDIVRFMLGRRLARQYTCVGGIIHDFYEVVSNLTGKTLQSRFEHDAATTLDWPDKPQASKTSGATALTMVNYDQNSRVTNIAEVLAVRGFVVGTCVKSKQHPEALITSMTNESVSLAVADTTVDVPASSFLANEWTITKPKAQPQQIDLRKFSFESSIDYSIQVMKAKIMIDVAVLTEKF